MNLFITNETMIRMKDRMLKCCWGWILPGRKPKSGTLWENQHVNIEDFQPPRTYKQVILFVTCLHNIYPSKIYSEQRARPDYSDAGVHLV